MIPAETTPATASEEIGAVPVVTSLATAPRARRRALLALGGITALLVLLWFGDALSGLVPRAPFHPTTQQAGAYRITLTIAPTQPTVGTQIHAQAHVTDAAGHPVPHATVSYIWEMVSMDMGTTHGTATADATAGTYDASVEPLMGGYWRLTIRIHTAQLPDGSTAFEIPARG